MTLLLTGGIAIAFALIHLYGYRLKVLDVMPRSRWLHGNHKGLYRKVGRWLLAAAIIAGWAIGSRYAISEAAIAVIFVLPCRQRYPQCA